MTPTPLIPAATEPFANDNNNKPGRSGVLYVELDGGVVTVDIASELLLHTLFRRPWVVAGWMVREVRSRAAANAYLTAHVSLPVETLPLNQAVLEHINTCRQRIVLVAAGDPSWAAAFVDHHPGFDSILIINPRRDRGRFLLSQIEADLAQHQETQFDYIGTRRTGRYVWQAARRAWITQAESDLTVGLRPYHQPNDRTWRTPTAIKALSRALRVRQWVKNLLVFVPLLFSHRYGDVPTWIASVAAFFSLSFAASAVYAQNDLLDIRADRLHPRKRRRPFASGVLSVFDGVVIGAIAAFLAFAFSLVLLPLEFLGWLITYLIASTVYSVYLKTRMLIDVFVLAGLFTLRILAGGTATGIVVSPWMLVFSGFFFLSLATCKRYVEMKHVGHGGGRRAYSGDDLGMLRTLGLSTGAVATLVSALYVQDSQVRDDAIYARPFLFWLLCPIVLFWVTRLWMLAERGLINTDPLVFAARDKMSYVLLMVVAVIFAVAGPL